MLDTDRLPTLARLVALSREEIRMLVEVARKAEPEVLRGEPGDELLAGRRNRAAVLREAIFKLESAL